VIRAEEWISSTPKHVVLYKAFGWEAPQFFHMPLLRNSDKSKISKRKNPVSINYYRDCGYLPRALLNFLGTMGWSFGGDVEKFTLQQMIEVFSWERMSLGGPVFNLEKLAWLNEQYIKDLTDGELADALIAWRFSREQLMRMVPLVRNRIKKLDDTLGKVDFLYAGDLDYKPVIAELAVPDVAPHDVAKALVAFVERFEAREGFTAAMLDEEAKLWVLGLGWKPKHAFMVLRVAISGRSASPELFPTMEVLGKEMTRRRLRRAAEALAALPKPKPAPAS
jgi:glutamyl-tRNA synthetase